MSYSTWSRKVCVYNITLQWLQEDFLGYLSRWKVAVEREGLKPNEKKNLILSETTEGLRITGRYEYIVLLPHSEIVCGDGQVFTMPSSFLKCKDISESSWDGQQRARGGRNENPNLQQWLYSAAAIRVQNPLLLTWFVRIVVARSGCMVTHSPRLMMLHSRDTQRIEFSTKNELYLFMCNLKLFLSKSKENTKIS